MECQHIKKGIVELINQIPTYKEEGKALFPEVFLVDNKDPHGKGTDGYTGNPLDAWRQSKIQIMAV